MAEYCLLFGIAELFVGKLASRAVEEASLALGVNDELREIKNTAQFIKAVLLDAEKKQHQNNELREWLRQIKRVFYDAEDVIDDFECEALRKQVVKTSGSFQRKVRRFLSTSSNPLAYRLRKAHEIKDIKKRLDKVGADRHKFGLQISDGGGDNHVVHQRELTHSHVVESDVIGREYDKEKIIDLLLMQDDDQSILSVVPIVGIGGLGKTTLAKSVFNDKRLNNESFPLKMWVCVSQDFDLKKLLVKIINSTGESAPENNFDMEQLQNHLRNTLASKKFLLVLDDVWNEDRVKWVELKSLIQVGTQGCKVLVTTRSHTVANVMGTHSPHILQGLSENDSLSIFVKWAFKEGEEKKYPTLIEIGKDIVKKCGGLPLALRTLGSSLFSKVDIQEWISVRDNDIWNLQQKEDDILPAIKLSFDKFPSHLKSCFACVSLFEKNIKFSSFNAVDLWAAYGFLPPPKKGQTLHDVCKQVLLELQSRSFLQDFFDYGALCHFELHDLVHDFALYVARDEFQQFKSGDKIIYENVLHLSFIKHDFVGHTPIPTYLRLRTLIFPPAATNEVFLNTFASRCKYLRVLKLNESRYESLPSSIGKLKHLRSLDVLSNKKLKRLPDSVCKLQSLQSLKLQHCTEIEALPTGIGNLISLRQLCISTKQYLFPNKEIAKLTSLEYLYLQSCNNLESLFEGVQLPSIKYLAVDGCGSLKSMSVHSLPNLETLYIENCSELNLSMGHDNQTPKLNLKFLVVSSLPQMVSIPQWLQGSANSLQTLVVDDCDKLDELPEWFSTFICLKSLAIHKCPKLPSLPDSVYHVLERLVIKDCPELYRRYQPSVGCDWHKISHIKDVFIHSDDDSMTQTTIEEN